jgi:transposase
LPELLKDASKIFKIEEVYADAGYISKSNVKAIAEIGAEPYINSKRNIFVPRNAGHSAWGLMLQKWKHNQILFATHYGRINNAESTFSAFKRKFGDSCRAKTAQSQENEVLCKIVCFNTSILSQSMMQFDLTTGFIAT